jgi:hypothetical protein
LSNITDSLHVFVAGFILLVTAVDFLSLPTVAKTLSSSGDFFVADVVVVGSPEAWARPCDVADSVVCLLADSVLGTLSIAPTAGLLVAVVVGWYHVLRSDLVTFSVELLPALVLLPPAVLRPADAAGGLIAQVSRVVVVSLRPLPGTQSIVFPLASLLMFITRSFLLCPAVALLFPVAPVACLLILRSGLLLLTDPPVLLPALLCVLITRPLLLCPAVTLLCLVTPVSSPLKVRPGLLDIADSFILLPTNLLVIITSFLPAMTPSRLITPVSSSLKVGARLCCIANPVVLLPTNLLVFLTRNYLLLFPAVTHNSVGLITQMTRLLKVGPR